MTGGNISKMLEEISTVRELTTFQALPREHLEKVVVSVQSRFNRIVDDVSKVWGLPDQPNNTDKDSMLRLQPLVASDISKLPNTTVDIELQLCFSRDWGLIGKIFANFPRLSTIQLR